MANSAWQSYVANILKYNGANCACLAGKDGSIWASSPDLKPTADEIKKIVDNVANGCHDSITINGKKLITIMAGDGELRAAGNDYAIDCRVLKSMVIITGNSNPKDCPGVNRLLAQAGCAMANYLGNCGY
ncbi:unnamed protein product [Hymenolepis diminuta]|uniref:Profilin n=1 Tax=Hymenolepis diminuta TaxID=6216 RepID=A0A0R3SA64_HYMDI|nr:unnamed protein product [Hymenolepis diminuta]VUZ54135.1 unnamed protein product [Hymenolepis diminuta]